MGIKVYYFLFSHLLDQRENNLDPLFLYQLPLMEAKNVSDFSPHLRYLTEF